MNYSFNILDWFALAPGLSDVDDWQQWAKHPSYLWQSKELAKTQKIPMMVARRMSLPSKVAVEVALVLAERNVDIDAAVFVSRHGETERTYQIVKDLANQKDISPTSFAMSVHNTAAGLFTIQASKAIAVSSLAAGVDSFQQGMLEVQALLAAGRKHVLLIDFDGNIPSIYYPKASHYYEGLVYAVGMLLTKGDSLSCRSTAKRESSVGEPSPQAIAFLQHYLTAEAKFTIQGSRNEWCWQNHYV